jgi:hypothetical protein
MWSHPGSGFPAVIYNEEKLEMKGNWIELARREPISV